MSANDDLPLILIVDDEYAIREVVTRILSNIGLRTLSVASATEALEILPQISHEVSLLLTDFQMPGMRGDQFIVHVRAETPKLRIILMTGAAHNPQYDTLFQSLAVSVLPKPFGERQLIARVKAVLGDAYHTVEMS